MEITTENRRCKIMTRLKSDYDMLAEKGFIVLGVFLYGSDNYNLSYEGSDIDTKALVIPSLVDVALNKEQVSQTIILESNEQIDVKDIRLYVTMFKKANINFVEILFTDYYILNPEYEFLFKDYILKYRELIARYDEFKTAKSIYGMSLEKFKALEHPYPTTKWKIDKFGTDGKQLHHIIRLKHFLTEYLKPNSLYSDCLLSSSTCDFDRQFMIAVKTNEAYNLEDSRKVANLQISSIKEMIDNFKPTITNTEENKHFVNELFDGFLIRVLALSFKLNYYQNPLKERMYEDVDVDGIKTQIYRGMGHSTKANDKTFVESILTGLKEAVEISDDLGKAEREFDGKEES